MHGISSDISRTIWGIPDKSDLALIKHSFRGMVAAGPGGRELYRPGRVHERPALTAAITRAHAGALKRFSPTSRVLIRGCLLREVVQKLFAEEQDRCERQRCTASESADDVEQFHPAIGLSLCRVNCLLVREAKLANQQQTSLMDFLEIPDF